MILDHLSGKLVSVVLPVFNERDSIAAFHSELFEVLHDLSVKVPGLRFEIVAVDDGSTDGTAEKLSGLNKVRVVRHPYNKGNGAAVKTGIRSARGEWIILMDADGQHPPAVIPELLEKTIDYPLVIAARTKSSHATLGRRVANSCYNVLASYLTRETIPDLTSGFRVVKADVAKSLVPLLPQTFSYPTTMTLSTISGGHPVCFVPFTARQREGVSKIRPIRDGLRFFLIIVKIVTLFSPMRIFIPLSFMFLFLGALRYGYTYYYFQQFTNMSALAFSTGVLIFVMGLVAEQIAQLRIDQAETRISLEHIEHTALNPCNEEFSDLSLKSAIKEVEPVLGANEPKK